MFKSKKRVIYFCLSISFFASFILYGMAEAQTSARILKTAKDSKIYLVVNNIRTHLPNKQALTDAGFGFKDVKVISLVAMNKIPLAKLNKSSAVQATPQAESDTTKIVANPVSVSEQPAEKIAIPQNFEAEGSYYRIYQTNISDEEYAKNNSKKSYSYLTADQNKLLKGDLNLLKTYPELEIQDINKAGDYVGCISRNEWDTVQAFAMIKGKLYKIGAIGQIYSCAYGINDKGQVVGTYGYKEGKQKGFLWDNGKITKLPALEVGDGGNVTVTVTGINNNGVIVGASLVQSSEKSGKEVRHATRWVNGEIEDLGNGYYSVATDVNDKGQIIGGMNGELVVWQDGKVVSMQGLVKDLQKGETVAYDSSNNQTFSLDGSLDLTIRILTYSGAQMYNGQVLPEISFRYIKIFLPDDVNNVSTVIPTSKK